jgi:predicted nucleotidyltransferase
VAKRQDAASSDVDIMIVSDDPGDPEFFQAVEELSQALGRKVNPAIYTSQELAARARRGNAFARRVLTQPKIRIIGKEDALGA